MFVGRTTYRDCDYSFMLDDDTLKIESVGNNGFHFLDAITSDNLRHGQKEFVCHCYFTSQTIVAIPYGPFFSCTNNTMIIRLRAMFVFAASIMPIYRMVLYSPELNYIYAAKNAIDKTTYSTDGKIEVQISPAAETTVTDGNFRFQGADIACQFSVSRTVNLGKYDDPFILDSIILLQLPERNDYEFHLVLFQYVRNFLRYLCYRKNVRIEQVSLQTKNQSGQFMHCCDLVTFEQHEGEPTRIISDRFIRYASIRGKAHAFLQDMVDGTLYFDHLPESYQNGKSISSARFIMIVAAFDWEFRQLYPDGAKRSATQKEAEAAIQAELSAQIDANSGKKKKIYKYLYERVQDESMEMKVVHVGKDLDDFINAFGKSMYVRASEVFDYSAIGKRLSQQRNNFAHGNIDKEFIGDSLYDIVFLERIVYTMQLLRHVKEKDKIQQAVSDLFNLNLDTGT